MKNELAVSTFALRKFLGPLRLTRRDPDGTKRSVEWGDGPATIELVDLPAQVRERLDLGSIEICQMQMPDRSPAYLDRLKKALADAGVTLVNVPIDVGNISVADERHREEDLAEIEEWMRVAARLGSRMVRVNASNPMGDAPLGPLDVTLEAYRRLAGTARSLGMQLLIENHGGITTDPEVIVRLVEGIGDGGLKTLVDIGNFEPLISAGMARFRGESVPEPDPEPIYPQLARIAPFAGLVHAKTHQFDERGRPKGLDVVRALRVVRDAGFEGPISIESEGDEGDPWENARRTRALVEEAFG